VQIEVCLMSDNPKQYQQVMNPTNGANFQDVCGFIMQCVEAEITVSCSAVAMPNVKMNSVRSLATSLGASSFKVLNFYSS
jgi:hypothetical protein